MMECTRKFITINAFPEPVFSAPTIRQKIIDVNAVREVIFHVPNSMVLMINESLNYKKVLRA